MFINVNICSAGFENQNITLCSSKQGGYFTAAGCKYLSYARHARLSQKRKQLVKLSLIAKINQLKHVEVRKQWKKKLPIGENFNSFDLIFGALRNNKFEGNSSHKNIYFNQFQLSIPFKNEMNFSVIASRLGLILLLENGKFNIKCKILKVGNTFNYTGWPISI